MCESTVYLALTDPPPLMTTKMPRAPQDLTAIETATEASLSCFLDHYLDAYFGRRDLDATLACLSPLFLGVGTGALELVADLNAAIAIYRQDLADAPWPVRYVFRHRQIRPLAPNLGLILVELDIETDVQGKLLEVPRLRISMTVSAPPPARPEVAVPPMAWRIEQMHVSVPNSAQHEDEIYPLRELKERAALLEKLTSELIRAEKRERTRIAGILHDHLQQLVVGARLGVEQAQRRLAALGLPMDGKRLPGEALDRVLGLLREGQQVMRDLVADLAPPILHEAGLPAALQWLAQLMRERYRQQVALHIETEVGPSRPEVRDLLFDAVRECLFNSVKHAKCRRAEVWVRQNGNNLLEVSIIDQGAGFDPSQVFDVGQGVSGHGLIGLRERFYLLGGRLDIDSRVGEGARVTLSVPLNLTVLAPVAAQGGSAAMLPRQSVPCLPAGRQVRILLVDDHRMVRDGLRALLADTADMQVIGEASSGEEAIDEVTRLQPDLVMMDVSMPGIGGVEATRRIRAQWPALRVIGLSMYADAERGTAMRAAGACDYLPKTGDVDALLAVIRRLFAATTTT